MRVLIMAGSYTRKLVEKACAKYQNTLDIEGLKYLDEVDSYINRGGDFDRVVIFSKCYTRDGEITDFDTIIGDIIDFTNVAGSRVPNYELILVVDDKEVGLSAVKATLGMRDRTTVVYKEAKSLSSAALYKLVADARHTLSSNFDILDLADVKNSSSYIGSTFEEAPVNLGPAEVGTVSNEHGDGDWYSTDDPFGSSGNEIDPFESGIVADGFENDGSETDPFGSIGTEADPFNDSLVNEKSLQEVEVGDIDNPFSKQFGETDPFGNGDDPFGNDSSEVEPNGSGDDPFRDGYDPFKSGDEPFGASDDPFKSGEEHFGNGDDPFKSGDEPFGASDDPFGSEGVVSEPVGGSEVDPFSSESNSMDVPFRSDNDSFNNGDDPFGSNTTEFIREEPERVEGFDSDPFDSADVTKSETVENDIETLNSSLDPFSSESEQFNDPFNSSEDSSNNLSDDPFGEDAFARESMNENFGEESLSGSIDDFEDEASEEISRASKNSENLQFEDPFGSTNANGFSDFDEPENNSGSSSEFNEASDPFNDGFSDNFDDDFEEVQRGPRNSSSRGSSLNSSAIDLFDDDSELDGTESMVADIEDEPEVAPQPRGRQGRKKQNVQKKPVANKPQGLSGGRMSKLKERLEVFKRNGCIITVTGGTGAGKTTVAGNIANMLCKMGYSILVVDMDTEGRGQSSITFDNFSTINSSGLETSGVRAALASTVDRTGRFVNIIRPGFHLLGTGIKVDKISPKECLEAKNVNRALHQWQNNYNFIIIDIPFDLAIDQFADMVTIANYVVMVEKMSSSGVMNLMIDMMNIQEEDVTDLMFEKAKIVFNMEDNCTSILGKKVSSTSQVLNAVDIRLSQLLGHQIPYSFEDMQVAGCIKYSRLADSCWFTKKYYSDIAEGNQVFSDILCNIFEV